MTIKDEIKESLLNVYFEEDFDRFDILFGDVPEILDRILSKYEFRRKRVRIELPEVGIYQVSTTAGGAKAGRNKSSIPDKGVKNV